MDLKQPIDNINEMDINIAEDFKDEDLTIFKEIKDTNMGYMEEKNFIENMNINDDPEDDVLKNNLEFGHYKNAAIHSSANLKHINDFTLNDLSYCGNCKILEEKYNIQLKRLEVIEDLETENAELKKRLNTLENKYVTDDLVEKLSMSNIINCFIQLFIDYYPNHKKYKNNQILAVDEALSLAHGLKLIILESNESVSNSLKLIYEIIHLKIVCHNKKTALSIFVLANMLELKSVLKTSDQNLEMIIIELYNNICTLLKDSIKIYLPYAILDYQGIKHLKEKQSFVKKILLGSSVRELATKLYTIYDILEFYRIPVSVSQQVMQYLFNFIDFESFNGLFKKRHFFTQKRCAQIIFNISEVKKLGNCFGGMAVNKILKNTREAINIMMLLLSNVEDKTLLDNSFLSKIQIKYIIELFINKDSWFIDTDIKESVFINEPKPIIEVPTCSSFEVQSFVRPLYIPRNSISSILTLLRDNEYD